MINHTSPIDINQKTAPQGKALLVAEMVKRSAKYPQYAGYYENPFWQLGIVNQAIEFKGGDVLPGTLVLCRLAVLEGNAYMEIAHLQPARYGFPESVRNFLHPYFNRITMLEEI